MICNVDLIEETTDVYRCPKCYDVYYSADFWTDDDKQYLSESQ